MSNAARITLSQVFRYKRPWGELPHQDAAVAQLDEALQRPGATYDAVMRRDQPWFHTWSQSGKQPDTPPWFAPASKIVAEFEGCRLTAYRCPAGIFTIGYGHTGPDVREGMTISQAQADKWLAEDLNIFAAGVYRLLPGASNLGANQQAALISWAFNVGLGAVEHSTLRKRLQAGESYVIVVPEELPKWNKAGNTALPGLTRRREAEVALFLGTRKPNPLHVPYYAQLDSSTDEGRRMCFSSSCAMLVAFKFPGLLKGPNGDDQYLQRVKTFGDTTDPIAQVNALKSYGIPATFTKNADFHILERQIDAGIPTPCGYLHRGPIDRPSGGGHWLIVVGYTKTELIVHDPLGEADLALGATTDRPARFARYNRELFGKRWMIEGPGSGWAIIASATA